ncbi:MAG: BamA/TamA family outer membrane protein, partial [Gammaproteobacteria bacterium]|nr:BamA/TamA family outer membrane protein [Gammaproteobacteria bacterium]
QYSKNLNSHRQVVLGGESGARAFDNRFQVGDRSVILTLEERLYTDLHLWNLIRVGGALFVDVGRAWSPDFDNGVEEELLADIGFGLRLASSKAASGRIAHIDFAFPMTNRDDPEVDSMQVAITIKGSF